ncbi:MAG: CDP-glycerol glycerophosphotransferase family protein [Oscillospiraceae bacterium]|nr:CDP-glycerol glycerophosphotransferase family protein [Candidatus Limimonas egerieequi]
MSKAEIREIEIEQDKMNLSLKITIPYDAAVHSPKVTLIYKMGDETRFIPILVQSYYPNVDGTTCTIIAGYKYNIECLFNEPIKDYPIEMQVDVLYGEEHLRDIPLELVGKVEVIDSPYTMAADDKQIVIKRRERYVEPKNNAFLAVLKFIVAGIYAFLVKIFGILLIPFLVIDSIFAFFEMKSGWVLKETRTPIRFFVDNVRVGFKSITHEEIGRKNLKKNWVTMWMAFFKKSKIVPNRITFLSNRRGELSGNPADVYEIIKDDDTLEIKMLLDDNPMHRMSFKNLYTFAKLYSTSRVVIIDDFYELTSMVDKKNDVKLVQVWHACGAFKTFGFSRLGKPGGPKQTSTNHRMYDRAIVSSKEIRRFYAEGFGIPIGNVVATGVPRTDMFFDEQVANEMKANFYRDYPEWQDKKIIMFAPTFRGNGRLTGHYPMEKFDLKEVADALGEEYGIIVKMHPFVNNPVEIPKGYENRIIDLSENSEINDLLFVTDILITDYSSVVFEASLLDIPMLFYAFDLSEYIATRDFYYEYEPFLPGKLTQTQDELVDAIKNEDFEMEKIEPFKHKFFDNLDGKSAERVASMVKSLL